MKTWAKQKGFTIVELLIVIVVIAVLATITIVAYNGIQGRARDTTNLNNGGLLKKAISLYYIDNNRYPLCDAGEDSICLLTEISDELTPKYVASLPDDVEPTRIYRYTATNTPTGDEKWSIRMYSRKTSNWCKIGSSNMLVTWFSSVPGC